MRILHVVGSLAREWGGLSLFVAEIAAEQARLGHEVRIFTKDFAADDGRWDSGPAVLGCPADTYFEEQVEAADIVHVHGLWLPIYHRALREARKYGKPHVLSTHGMLEPAAFRFSPWKKRAAWLAFQKRDLSLATLLHATTATEESTIRRKRFGQPITVVPPGVRLPKDLPQDKEGRNPRTALFLGRIHPAKGIELLVDAWACARPAGWRLVIAGPDEGGHRAQIEVRIRTAGLTDQVVWMGPVFDEAKVRALANADLLVVPSLTENFGIVVAEGMAHGLPVLATTGAPWKSLVDHQCGWWVSPTADGITEGLRTACGSSPAVLREMGRRGRDMAAAQYQWKAGAEKLVTAYRWLLVGGHMPESVSRA